MTKEEAEIAWNKNTAIVADTELSIENMRALVSISEEWKDRAMVGTELSQGLSQLMQDVINLMKTRGAELVAKHKADPRYHWVEEKQE